MPTRRRISRETRQLLTAALVALVTLWVLARVRFPDSPATSNPLPSLLSLSAPSPLAELASEVAELQSRLSGSLLVVPPGPEAVGAGGLAALRVDSDVAIVAAEGTGIARDHLDVLASDEATGLTVIRVAPGPSGAVVAPWPVPAPGEPRFLLTTSVSPSGVSLRPVLLGTTHQTPSTAWRGLIWAVPTGTDLTPGAIVFTTSGELAGLVTAERGVLAVVPGDLALAAAKRLMEHGPHIAGGLHVDVQPLTPPLARATGAPHGVVVAHVDALGPSAGLIIPGDVIETIDGHPVLDLRDWAVLTRRTAAGDRVRLRVRRSGEPVDLSLVAVPPAPDGAAAERPPTTRRLGLRLRSVAGSGSLVVDVAGESAAAAAGLAAGDLITAIAGSPAPTPALIEQVFVEAKAGTALVVAYTRGDTHGVLALAK